MSKKKETSPASEVHQEKSPVSGSRVADSCILDVDPTERLSHLEWLTLHGGEELSKAVDWIAKKFTSFDPAAGISGLHLPTVKEAVHFYKSFLAAPDAAVAHSFFAEVPHPPFSIVSKKIHTLAGGEIFDASFLSSYECQHRATQEKLFGSAENQRARFRLWKVAGKARGTVIAIHGWTMGDQRLNSLAFIPGQLLLAGYNVLLPELPFHGRRASPQTAGVRHPQFPSADPYLTNEALGQAVHDLRSILRYAEQLELPGIGVIGFSLGAYMAALLASVEKLHFAIPLLPLVSMAESAWSVLTKTEQFEQLKSEGLTLETLYDLYQVHSPLSYQLLTPKSRVLIVGGLGDTMVPARQTNMLREHWGRPELQWIDGGHAAHLRQSRGISIVLKALEKFC